MGYKVKFDSGQTVEFDRPPTPEDIEEAHASISQNAELDGQLGKLKGMGEAALGVGSSLLAGSAQGLRTLGELATGADLGTALERSDSSAEALTYNPSSVKGKEYNKDVMDTLHKYQQEVAKGFAGSQANINKQKLSQGTLTAADLAGENTEQAVGEFIGGVYAPGLVAPSRKVPQAKKPTKGLDVDALKAKMEAEAQQAKTGETPRVDMDVTNIHDQAIVSRLQELNEILTKTEGAEKGFQRKLRAEEAPVIQGKETLNVDPQGQVFKGDPREADARLGLERQTEAFDNAATYNQWPQKQGDPLPLLTKDNLRATNEGPQLPLGEEGLQHQFKAELVDQHVNNHPLVKKAEERITKQEELVIKLQEQVKKGKAQVATLAREVKNLENFETALEKTRANVLKGAGEGQAPAPFTFGGKGGSQRGAINPEVFKEGFEKLKKIGDNTWLRATGKKDGSLQVDIIKDSHLLGAATFDPKKSKTGELNAEAFSIGINPEARNKGYATEVYKFVSELGNDIQKSDVQMQPGRGMWEAFERNGLAQDGIIKSPGNKQKGALLIDPTKQKQGKILEEHPALKLPSIVSERLSIDQVKEISKAVPDVEQNALQQAINLFTKGGQYQALKTDHPVVKYTYEHLNEADRLGRGDIQTHVHDNLGPTTRALSTKEKAEIWGVISTADMLKKELTPELLREYGANDKQIAYWQSHKEVMERAFEAANKARAAAGMEPIKQRPGYAAMKADGDFRQLVYKLDENGERVVAGIVGSDFRPLLQHRARALMDKGYELGEVKYYGGVPKHADSAQMALQQVLEVLAKDDPRVAEFYKVMEDITTNEAYNFLNAKKHTLDKKGVFGMEGRKTAEGVKGRPSNYWTKLAEMNAQEGMQSQLSYAETMLKWGRFSEAVEAIKPILADGSIEAPNAKLWADHYVKNALGYNPSKLGHYLELGLAEGFGSKYNFTGVGYSKVRETMAFARKSVNTVLLALDPVFIATNLVQPMKAMPGMMAYLESKGLKKNFDFGTGWSYLGKAAITDWKYKMGGKLTEVEKGAFEYAKSHRVYGSDLVEQSNRASKDIGYKVDKLANFGLSHVESATREIMFLGMVDMLHQNGLSVKNGLYEAAHNLTDMTMNNYSPIERPPVYNAMGPIGDMAVNLSSFKHNEMSRIALFARQLAEEKTAKPLLAELGAQIAFAGMKGIIAYEAADWLYRYITKQLGKPDSLSLRIIKMSEGIGDEVNKLTGAKKGELGDARYALSHGGFSMLGLDMSKRLGLGHVVGDNAVDVLFPGGSKIVDVVSAGAKAVGDPTEMNAKRFASEIVPRPGATNMELEWFSKNDMGYNKRTVEAQVPRNKLDIFAKRIGGTGIHESVTKEKLYQTDAIRQAYADKRKVPLEHARDEFFSTGKVSEETVKEYLKNEGDITTLLSDINRIAKNQTIPAKDRELLKAAMSRSITSLRHGQRLKEVYKE